MLAAGSFSSPYEHLSQPETKRMVEHYTAYLSDNTRLIANPGLKVPAPENQGADGATVLLFRGGGGGVERVKLAFLTSFHQISRNNRK